MATNFLLATGGSTTGYFAGVTTVISSELVSLASSGTATGATVFTSSANMGQAIWGRVIVEFGGTITPAVGGFITGWFLKSPDGGTTFESTNAATLGMPRSPDFIIPLSTSYVSSGVAYATGLMSLPWSPFKVFIMNNAGAALPSSASKYTIIQIGPVAVQY